jgi:hypothetical protein
LLPPDRDESCQNTPALRVVNSCRVRRPPAWRGR